MSTLRWLRRAPLAVVLVLTAGGSWAQDVPPEYEQDVESWVVEADRKESPFYVGRFQDVHAADLAAGRVGPVLGHMLALFDALDWGNEEAEQAKILRQTQAFLLHVERAVAAPSIVGPVDTLDEQNAFLAALGAAGISPRALVLDTVFDAENRGVPGYFADTDDELPLYAWEEDGEHVRFLLAREHVRQWRLLENSITALVAELYTLVATANVESFEKALTRWENFLDRGYSQMPWESLVNGYLIPPKRLGPDSDELGPPEHQWILLHPSLGVEFDPSPLDETRVKESLQVELIGHVWYRGQELDQYWGVSAALSLREDLDPGLGLLVHLRRNWSLGITWHDVDEDPFLFLSFDLFRFARTTATRYRTAVDGIRERL